MAAFGTVRVLDRCLERSLLEVQRTLVGTGSVANGPEPNNVISEYDLEGMLAGRVAERQRTLGGQASLLPEPFGPKLLVKRVKFIFSRIPLCRNVFPSPQQRFAFSWDLLLGLSPYSRTARVLPRPSI